MTFKIIKGDLFHPSHNFDALAQGVNTRGIMGAGIAVTFRDSFPEMYTEYQAMCKRFGKDLSGLIHIYNPTPTVSFPKEGDDGQPVYEISTGQTIYNLFSQTEPGANAQLAYLRTAAIMMRQDAESYGFDSVGLPWIGAGIGGLQRHNVQNLFEDVLGDSEVDFVLVERD